jgi:hypothetical protein
MNFGFTIALEDDDIPPEEPGDDIPPEEPGDEEPKEPEEPEEPKDDDHDGVDDDVEEDEKRNIEIWFGDNVVEMASILRHGDQKDIIEMRIGYNEHGISVRVSFGTYVKNENPEEPEEPEEPGDDEPKEPMGVFMSGGEHDGEEWIEYKLKFEVFFRGIIEYVDLNGNGVFDLEIDSLIEDYGINSFQPIAYTLTPISDDSNLHYFLLNTTDGIFATHIYFVEEFVYIDDNLISPTEAKIDVEITNYNYLDDNSQLALITKLRSEENLYKEREENEDEKEVFVENDIYTGIFSWKETALIDGVEMEVLTNNLEVDVEDENVQILLINYPRGNHIYHDPKIGITVATLVSPNGITSVIITGTLVAVIGAAVAAGFVMRKRRVIW